jgi:hypothetical protein
MGQPLVVLNPGSAAAKRYASLAKQLGLVEEPALVGAGAGAAMPRSASVAKVPMSEPAIPSRSAVAPPEARKPSPEIPPSPRNGTPRETSHDNRTTQPPLKVLQGKPKERMLRLPPEAKEEAQGVQHYLMLFAVMVAAAASGFLFVYLMR